MRRILLLCILLSFSAIAQDKGDLIFIYDAPNEYNRVTQELYFNKGLEKYKEYLNRKFAFPFNITVHFTDCANENAFYSNGKITICYNYIKTKYERVRQNLIDSKVVGHEKLEREAVLGLSLIHI